MSQDAVLCVAKVTKSFGSTRALHEVDLALRRGEVHALVGENGAGKSTLMKIVAGAVRPDAGRLIVRGAAVKFGGVRDALAHGIVPIYQQLSLMPHLSVLENLAAFEISRGAAWSRLSFRGDILDRARKTLGQVGLDIPLRWAVEDLSLAERQLVEIARGLLREGDVLILDEPTAALNRVEVDRLFAVVRGLRERGWAVLFISHRLDEVEEIADRVSVLRDGRLIVCGASISALSRQRIIEAMVGRAIEGTVMPPPRPGAPVLEAQGLTAPGAFSEVSLTVCRGEILGIVGLIGSGAIELGAALAGAYPVRSGRLLIGGRSLRTGDRAAALEAGVGFLPVDRESDGLFPTRSVLQNASASMLIECAQAGILRPRHEAAQVARWLHALAVKPATPDAPILTLSGGNQQKVMFIRSVASGRKQVLVALEPSRGVDVRTREEIRQAVASAAREGLAIVVVSSDLAEVTALSGRVIVMRGGRIAAELPPGADSALVLRHLTEAAP